MSKACLVLGSVWFFAFLCGCVKKGRGSETSNLNVAVSVEISSLDPQITSSIAAIKIQSALFTSLVQIDHETGEIRPSGAVRWKVSKDGLRYRFELDPTIKWSDGKQVTAMDYVFSFQRLLNQQLGAPFADLYFGIKGAKRFFESRNPDPKRLGVHALENTVLEIELEQPVPYFLSLLARPCVASLPEHYLSVDDRRLSRTAGWSLESGFPCSGPYVLKEWVVNQHILLEQNQCFPGKQELRFEKIHFFPIESAYGQERGFLSGALDVISLLASERVSHFREDSAFVSQLEMGTAYVITNAASGPLVSVAARNALFHAIDRKSIVEKLRQRGERPAFGFSPPLWKQYHPDFGNFSGNAKETDRVWPESVGRKLTFLISSSEGNLLIAEALQEMWNQSYGIEVEIVTQEWKSYLESRRSGDFELCLATWIGDYFDPLTFLEMWQSDATNNFCNWKNTEYDRLIAQAQGINEAPLRFGVLAQAEELLMRESPVLPLYYLSRVYLKNEKVETWPQTILNTVNYTEIK